MIGWIIDRNAFVRIWIFRIRIWCNALWCYYQSSFYFRDRVVTGFCSIVQFIVELVLAASDCSLSSGYIIRCAFTFHKSFICYIFICQCLAVVNFLIGCRSHCNFSLRDIKFSVFHYKFYIFKVLIAICEVCFLKTHLVRSRVCLLHFGFSAELDIGFCIFLLICIVNVCNLISCCGFLCSIVSIGNCITNNRYNYCILIRCYCQFSFYLCDGVVFFLCICVQSVSKCVITCTYFCLASGYIIRCAFTFHKSFICTLALCNFLICQRIAIVRFAVCCRCQCYRSRCDLIFLRDRSFIVAFSGNGYCNCCYVFEIIFVVTYFVIGSLCQSFASYIFDCRIPFMILSVIYMIRWIIYSDTFVRWIWVFRIRSRCNALFCNS